MPSFDSILKIKSAYDTFVNNHPKFPLFLNAVKNKGVPVGTEIKIDVVYPDGQTIKGSVKVQQSDLELMEILRNIKE